MFWRVPTWGWGFLLPFLAISDDRRQTVINTIGPHWEDNDVRLLTGDGATFVAFPN
jgi:cytochrome d ubiquinol oxidase subunit II